MGLSLKIRTAESGEMETLRTLFREYQEEIQADLCFQSFEEELTGLPGKYSSPGGILLLAEWEGTLAGCGAFRPLDPPGICEMKRLFVRGEFKGKGIGRSLAERLISEATKSGYHSMRLDTLEKLKPALKLYKTLQFKTITPYYPNPLEGVVYMERNLNGNTLSQ